MSLDDQLERLARLWREGVLSDEEFEQSKSRLVASQSGSSEAEEDPASAAALSSVQEPQGGDGSNRSGRIGAVPTLLLLVAAALLGTGVAVLASRSDGSSVEIPTLENAIRSTCKDSRGDQIAELDPGDGWSNLTQVRLESDGSDLLAVFVLDDSVPTSSASRSGSWSIVVHDEPSGTDFAVNAIRTFDNSGGPDWVLQVASPLSPVDDPSGPIELDPSAVEVDGNIVSFRVALDQLPTTAESIQWVASAIQTGEVREVTDLVVNRAYDLCPGADTPPSERVANIGLNMWDRAGPHESLQLRTSGSDAAVASSTSNSPVPTQAPSETSSSSSPQTSTASGAPDCPVRPAETSPASAETAAQCTYWLYVVGDRASAEFYAVTGVLDSLFETPYQPPEWEFIGCEEGESAASSGVACSYFIPDDFHGVGVEMLLGGGPDAGGYFVEELNFYG